MQSLFFSDAGGQGCAAGKYGVPVLWWLGGVSRTGLVLQRAILFLARAVDRRRKYRLQSKPACAPFFGTCGLIALCTWSELWLRLGLCRFSAMFFRPKSPQSGDFGRKPTVLGRKPTVGLLEQADGRLTRLWTATPGASSLAIVAQEKAPGAMYLYSFPVCAKCNRRGKNKGTCAPGGGGGKNPVAYFYY